MRSKGQPNRSITVRHPCVFAIGTAFCLCLSCLSWSHILWCFKICTYTVFYFYCSLWINAWYISSSGRLELAELHTCLCHYLLGTCSRSGSPALSRSCRLTKAVHNTSLFRQTALKLSCSVIQDNPEKKENVNITTDLEMKGSPHGIRTNRYSRI